MTKAFILDTNVLLHDPMAIFKFEDNDVIIPLVVIEEMDEQKKRHDEVGRNARKVAKLIDALRLEGKIYEGITLQSGGVLKVEINHQFLEKIPKVFKSEKSDNRILAVAIAYQEEGSERPVVLVTKDTYLRIKADVMGITSEDYKTDKINYEELYTGVEEFAVNRETINTFYLENFLPKEKNYYPNQFVSLVSSYGDGQTALAKFDAVKNGLVSLHNGGKEAWGIKARNREQRFAMDLLLDDNIKLVTLIGQAGTGKTLLALAAGLQKVIDEGSFKKLLITRPVVPLGNDIGFLPGDKDEKLRPWMSPIYDNLEFILSLAKDPRKDPDKPRGNNIETIINYFKDKGQLEMEAITYIRGRTIPYQYIIVDEAQNLTPHEVKTLLTRAGEGTKVVLTGDPQQIDHPYLGASSNGLSYVVDKFKQVNLAGHVTLVKGERSELAKLAADLI